MDFSDDLANIIGSNERSAANNGSNANGNSDNANGTTEYRTHNIFDMGAPAHAGGASYHPYRHTPSPTTGTSQTHRSHSRSGSRPPSSNASSTLNNFGVPIGSNSNSSGNNGDAGQGGGGSVGPTRTTRSRRNNSISSVSPPPHHSRPQAILIPGGSTGHGGNGAWFGGNGGAGEFTLPTPDSLTSPLSAHSPIHTSHSHSHSQHLNHHPGSGAAASYGSSPHHNLHGLHQHGSFSDIDFGVGLTMNGMPSSTGNTNGGGGRNIPISGGYTSHHGHSHGGGHPSSFGPSSFGSMSSSLGLGSPSEHGALHHHQQHQHQQGNHSSQHQGHHGGMMGDETPLSASLPTLPTSLHDLHPGHGHGHQQQQQQHGHGHGTRSNRSHSVSVVGAKADAGGNATPTPGGMGFNLSTLNVNVGGHGLGMGMSSPTSIPSHISSISGANHNHNHNIPNLRGAELNLPNVMTNLSTTDKQALLANEKRRRRRESHNAVERRRRDNINEKISELATLIPECMLEGTTSNNNTKDSSNSPNPNNASSPPGGPTLNTLLPNSSNGGALSTDSPTSPTSALSLMSPTDGGEGGLGVWNLDMGVEMLVPKKEEVDEGTASGTGSGAGGSGGVAAGVVKANKGMILRKSVEYIRYLQQLVTAQGARNRELEQELKTYRAGGVPSNATSTSGPGGASTGEGSSPAHSQNSDPSTGQGGNASGLTLDGMMMGDIGGDINQMNVGEGMGMGMNGEMTDVPMGMNNMGMFDMNVINGVNGMIGMPVGMDIGNLHGHGISNVRGMYSNQYGGRTLHTMREEGEEHEGKQAQDTDVEMDTGDKKENGKGRSKEESGMLSPVSPPRNGLPPREQRASSDQNVEEDQDDDQDEDSDSEGSGRKRKRRNGRNGPGKKGEDDEDEDYVDEEVQDGRDDEDSIEVSKGVKTRVGVRGKGKTLSPTKNGIGEEKESRGRRGRDGKLRRGSDDSNGVVTRTRRGLGSTKTKAEDGNFDGVMGVGKGQELDDDSGTDDVEEQVGRLRTRRARRLAGGLDDDDDGMEY